MTKEQTEAIIWNIAAELFTDASECVQEAADSLSGAGSDYEWTESIADACALLSRALREAFKVTENPEHNVAADALEAAASELEKEDEADSDEAD